MDYRIMPFTNCTKERRKRINKTIAAIFGMPEASLLESARPQDSLPTSLTMKRPADDLDMPDSPENNAIHPSINAIQDHYEQPMVTDLGDDGEDMHMEPRRLMMSMPYNHVAKRPRHDEDSIGGSEPSTSPQPDDSGMDSDCGTGGVPEDDDDAGPRPFPCVWLSGMSGLPITEEPPESPNYNHYDVANSGQYMGGSSNMHMDELEPQISRHEEAHEHHDNGIGIESEAPFSPARPYTPTQAYSPSRPYSPTRAYSPAHAYIPARSYSPAATGSPATNTGTPPPSVTPDSPLPFPSMPAMSHPMTFPNLAGAIAAGSMPPDGSKSLPPYLASRLLSTENGRNTPPGSPSTPPSNGPPIPIAPPGLSPLPPPGTIIGDGIVFGPENLPMETCPECHKQFKRKVYLQRHMEREHWSTAKVFKCEDCSYETKHQSNLSVHRRIHTGERPYNCGACGQTYTQGHLLKSHIRSRHEGNMAFYNLDHKNGERPYHCGACGQRYTQGHLLKSHIRSRHGGNMELYNLEKKSDSTRGRKSLDLKHDGFMHGMGFPGAKGLPMNPLLPPSVSQFMSSMSYMHSMRPLMANPLGIGAATGLLGPRMLTMGGGGLMPMPLIGHPALPPPSSPMVDVKPPHMMKHDIFGAPIRERANITELPDESAPQDLTVKKSEGPSPVPISPHASPMAHQVPRPNSPRNLSVSNGIDVSNGNTSPRHGAPLDLQCSPNRSGIEPPVPLMISPTKRPLTPSNMMLSNHTSSPSHHGSPNHHASPHSHASTPPKMISPAGRHGGDIPHMVSPSQKISPSSQHMGPIDFSHAPEPLVITPMGNPAAPHPIMQDGRVPPSPIANDLKKSMQMHLEQLKHIEHLKNMDPLKSMEALKHMEQLKSMDQFKHMDALKRMDPLKYIEQFKNIDSLKHLDPLKMMEAELMAGFRHTGKQSNGCDSDCSHAKKLRSLRKNIVRMLSVLTPDLSIEQGLDCNSDQVDDLLHEVIYSNIEEHATSA